MRTRSRHRPSVKTGARIFLTQVHLNRDVLKRAQQMGWIPVGHDNTDKNNNSVNKETVLPSRSLNGSNKRKLRTEVRENVLPPLREDACGLLKPESHEEMQCKVRRISNEKPATPSMDETSVVKLNGSEKEERLSEIDSETSIVDKASMLKHNEIEKEAQFNEKESESATQEPVQTTQAPRDNSVGKPVTPILDEASVAKPNESEKEAQFNEMESENTTQGTVKTSKETIEAPFDNSDEKSVASILEEESVLKHNESEKEARIKEVESENATQATVQIFKESTEAPFDNNKKLVTSNLDEASMTKLNEAEQEAQFHEMESETSKQETVQLTKETTQAPRDNSDEKPVTFSLVEASMAKHNQSEEEAQFSEMESDNAKQETVQIFKDTTEAPRDNSVEIPVTSILDEASVVKHRESKKKAQFNEVDSETAIQETVQIFKETTQAPSDNSDEKPASSILDEASVVNQNENEEQAQFNEMDSEKVKQEVLQFLKEMTRAPLENSDEKPVTSILDEASVVKYIETDKDIQLNEMESENVKQETVQSFKETTEAPRSSSDEKPAISILDEASVAGHNESEKETQFNEMESENATNGTEQTFKETIQASCYESETGELGDVSEDVFGEANMGDDHNMSVCNEDIFYSEDENDKTEFETFQTVYIPANEEIAPPNTEEGEFPADEVKSPCQVQISSHEHDQQKQTNLPSTKENSTSSKDDTGSVEEEEILSCSGCEETKVDNEKFQSMLKDAVVRSAFTSTEAEKEQSKIHSLKKKLALLEEQNRELQDVTLKLQSRMSELEKEVDKKTTHGTQVNLDAVLKRSSGRTNDTPRSPVSVNKSSRQIETSVASKRQLQQAKTQTLQKTARHTSFSTSQEQQDDHSKKSHEPLIVVKKEPLDCPDCNSCPFAGNATTSITGNIFTSCANNHEASSNSRNCTNAVPLRTIPPNTFYAVQYPQHPLMTQPNFQALQSKVQVPLSPGYAFPCEESRVGAPRISQQASVKSPVRENMEMFNNTAMMNAFVPSDDLTPLRQNRYSYLWMRRRFPHYFHLLHEQQQQQQQQQEQRKHQKQHPTVQQHHPLMQQQQHVQQHYPPMQQKQQPQQYVQQHYPPMQLKQQPQQCVTQHRQHHSLTQRQKRPIQRPLQCVQQHQPSMQLQQQPQQYVQQQHPPMQQEQQALQCVTQHRQHRSPTQRQQPVQQPSQCVQQQHPSMQQEQQPHLYVTQHRQYSPTQPQPQSMQLQPEQYLQQQQQQQQNHPLMQQGKQQKGQDPNIPKQKHQQQEPQGYLQTLQNFTETIQMYPEVKKLQHQGRATIFQTPEPDAFTSSSSNIITTISGVVAKDTADAVSLGVGDSNFIYLQHPQPDLSVPRGTVENETVGKSGQQHLSTKRSTNVMLLTPPTTPLSLALSGVSYNRGNDADTASMLTTVASSTQNATVLLKANEMASQKQQWKTTPNLSVPPPPVVSVTLVRRNVVMSWSMTNVPLTPIAKYELFSYLLEDRARSEGDPWRHVGTLTAMPLPMACSLTEFEPGMTYYFSVRAVDIYGCKGKLSPPCKVTITVD